MTDHVNTAKESDRVQFRTRPICFPKTANLLAYLTERWVKRQNMCFKIRQKSGIDLDECMDAITYVKTIPPTIGRIMTVGEGRGGGEG